MSDLAPFTQIELDNFGQAARNLRWLLEHPGECLPSSDAQSEGAAPEVVGVSKHEPMLTEFKPRAALKSQI